MLGHALAHLLTHWGRVIHASVSSATIGSDNWIRKDKIQWNLNWNFYIFIRGNVLKNVVWNVAAILFRLSVLIYQSKKSRYYAGVFVFDYTNIVS